MKKMIQWPLAVTMLLTLGLLTSNFVAPEVITGRKTAVKQTVLGKGIAMCRTGGQYILDLILDKTKPIAPKLEGLGDLHFPITTQSAEAQAFFDQGLRLIYAFNHAEAHRAFMEVSRLDPKCAMAHWGEALALGPNINDPFPDMARQKMAYKAMKKAKSLADGATAIEKDLIGALMHRHSDKPVEQATLNANYAEAMTKVYASHGDHPDVGTLYGAAVMNTMPWDYYDENNQPKGQAPKAIAAIEKVVAEHPGHPGAHHYYIHIIEAVRPDDAVPSADALATLMPKAGHIVHMPSHIYISVGRYADAAEVNRRAIVADEEYIAQCQAQGMYPLVYYPHNLHFLWAAATMLGNSDEAIRTAQKTAFKVQYDMAEALPFLQDFLSVPLQSYVRFGKWNQILTTPPPPENLVHSRMIWHYARGMAFSRKGMHEEAKQSLAEVAAVMENPVSDTLLAAYNNPTTNVTLVAHAALAGEMAMDQGNYEEAIQHFSDAVRHEDNLVYQEPAAWHYPSRHSLGAALLAAGKAADAEAVYRKDLSKNRNNGWALFGLMQALEAQGKADERAKTEKAFRQAWKEADIELNSSRL